MSYDFKKFKDLLAASSLSVVEASKIFKVSRPTIYHWSEGNAPTQEVLFNDAVRKIGLIIKAVKSKDLPLVNTEKPERLKAITEALRKQLNGG